MCNIDELEEAAIVVSKMGSGAHSSDEEEIDRSTGEPTGKFLVSQKEHRAASWKAYFRQIDILRTCVIHRDLRGGTPRERVDSLTDKSTRPWVIGAPVNYYNEKLYKKLPALDKRRLKAKPAFELVLPQWALEYVFW